MEGKLSEKEALEVQFYLADHIDDPMVQELLDEQFDSGRTESDVSAKRAAAAAAIEEAKKRVAESEKFAEEADVKAPITEQVEGIEDEDAVLLEADDYEDPEDAEVEIAEELEDVIVESEAK